MPLQLLLPLPGMRRLELLALIALAAWAAAVGRCGIMVGIVVCHHRGLLLLGWGGSDSWVERKTEAASVLVCFYLHQHGLKLSASTAPVVEHAHSLVTALAAPFVPAVAVCLKVSIFAAVGVLSWAVGGCNASDIVALLWAQPKAVLVMLDRAQCVFTCTRVAHATRVPRVLEQPEILVTVVAGFQRTGCASAVFLCHARGANVMADCLLSQRLPVMSFLLLKERTRFHEGKASLLCRLHDQMPLEYMAPNL